MVSGGQGLRGPHPCVGIERDNRLAVTRLLRELDLDADAGTAWPASDLLEPGSSTCSRRGRLNSAVWSSPLEQGILWEQET